MRMGKRIVLTGLAVLAIVLFIFSLILPLAIGFAGGPGHLVPIFVSFGSNLRIMSVIASIALVVAAIAPVLRPTAKSWVFPLVGALVILVLASLTVADHFFGKREGSLVWLTVCVFALSGVVLLGEAITARHLANRAP